jgi:DNA-binding transcriptional LysR family regulator
MTLDLKQLHYAVTAARHGSFRRAAKALNIEESSLSRHIRQLEHSVGATLFIRSRAGVQPTFAGERFLRSASHIIEQSDQMTAAARAIGQGKAGELAVGFFTSITAGNLRAVLFAFEERFADVAIHGIEEDRSNLMAALDAGVIDIVIVSGATPHVGTRHQAFWSERMLVVLPAGHRLASQEPIYWSDLRGETFLGSRYTGAEVQDMVTAHLVQPGHRPSMVHHDMTRESVFSAISAGRGITLACEASLGLKVADVVLRELHDLGGPVTLGFSGYWRADNHSPVLRRFLDFVRARYSLTAPRGEIE